ncbi:hypothetical protein WMY93_014760 [Mugilogobius chulae]|uniref:G-protein coupled receptors family 1 profile domain-containing protein n=1 Tax=Mugilogobius chulae TaxID=88201 RepID=A0AAW0P599_9GOBI
MVMIEMLTTFGAVLFLYGLRAQEEEVALAGCAILTIGLSGQTFFHSLTCVERYLAVVHPITYLRLKKRGGVTIRNIGIGGACVSALCALIRPGPGEGGTSRKKLDHSKRSAITTLTAILGILLISLVLSPQQSGSAAAVSASSPKTTNLLLNSGEN